jgi:hypothetical protein
MHKNLRGFRSLVESIASIFALGRILLGAFFDDLFRR